MKKSDRKWSWAEISLFATPFLFLVLLWSFNSHKAPKLRRLVALPVAPTATVVPTPTPTTPSKIREVRLIWQIVPAPDGRTLWTLNHLGGKSSIHQFSVGAKVWMRAIDKGVEIFPPALQISADGRTLLYGWSGDKGEYAELFDVKSGKSRLRLTPGIATSSVAISPDSRFFALAFEGYFEIRSLKTGQLIHRIHWQSGKKMEFLRDACFSRDGKFFAVSDGIIGVFSTQNWQPVARYCPPLSTVVTFAFAGKHQLAVRSQDKKKLNLKSAVWLYNFQSRKVRWLRALESSGGYALAVSPDEKFVAISDSPNSPSQTGPNYVIAQGGSIVEIYNVQMGMKVAAGQIEEDDLIPALAFSADSQTLFMGGENGRIRRWPKANWDLNSPKPL